MKSSFWPALLATVLTAATSLPALADSTSSLNDDSGSYTMPQQISGSYNVTDSDGLRYSQHDAYWDLKVVFNDKTTGNPEVIWGTGSNIQGMSLLYEQGNILGFYLNTGASGSVPELKIEYPLPEYLANTSQPITINWTIALHYNGTSNQAAIALWVNNEQVAMASGVVTNQQWATVGGGLDRYGEPSNNGAGSPIFAGGVDAGYFGLSTFANFISHGTVDYHAGLRYWENKNIVSVPVDWQGVRDPQWVATHTTSPLYLSEDGSGNVAFSSSAPSSTAGQWNLVPVTAESEWFYLVNESTGQYAYRRTSDGQVLCSALGSIGDLTTAQWKWDKPDITVSNSHEQLACHYNYSPSGTVYRLTTRNATQNPITSGFAFALTGVDPAWEEATWSKYDFIATTPAVTGAAVPFVTLQAESGALGGGAAVLGDYRQMGLASDLNATAAEAIGRQCVELSAAGDTVDLVIPSGAVDVNFISLRYSIPDDFTSRGEYALNVQVKRAGGSSFSDVQVLQASRYQPASGSVLETMIPDSGYHYSLELNARYLWNYWRFSTTRGNCARNGDHAIDGPDPSAIDPAGCGCPLLTARNQDRSGNWLTPYATRRFDDLRAFIDPSIGPLEPGDTIRFQLPSSGTAAYVILDCLDVEHVASAATMPSGFISITDPSMQSPGDTSSDYADALNNAIAAVESGSYSGVWIPSGFFPIGSRIDLGGYGKHIEIQGAGMAYSILWGYQSGPDYPDSTAPGYQPFGFRNFGFAAWKSTFASGRTTYDGGPVVKLSGFSMLADSTERDEGGQLLGGSFGPGSEIHDMDFEHAATVFSPGMGAADGNPQITVNTYYQQHLRTHGLYFHDCRVRNLGAGGILPSTGSHNVLIENLHVRGTGDDSFAVSSGGFRTDAETTHVVFKNCTAEAPWAGDGYAAYGGYHNLFQNVLAGDVDRAGAWLAAAFNPAPFGANEYQLTFMRDFEFDRCGRPDLTPSVSWYPGVADFHGALRISSEQYRDFTNPGGVPDSCGQQSPPASGPVYTPTDLANVMVQSGIISNSTNDGLLLDCYQSFTNYLNSDGTVNTSSNWPNVKNVVVSNLAIGGIPASSTTPPNAAVQAYDTAGLQGAAIMNNITITSVDSSSSDLYGPWVPSGTVPAPFSVTDAATGGGWTP